MAEEYTKQNAEITFIGPGVHGRRRNDTVVMGAVQRRLEAMYPYQKGHWQRVSFEAIHALVAGCTDSGIDYMQNADVRRAVERHPVVGAKKLEELGFPRPVVLAVRHHHEWYNGWGYPDGLSGVAIPLLARILMVADAFVSITSERPFRSGCTPAEALGEIVGYAGVQFDPWVVPALEKIVTQKAHATESLIDKTLDLALEEEIEES
jgi:hypothetical protein